MRSSEAQPSGPSTGWRPAAAAGEESMDGSWGGHTTGEARGRIGTRAGAEVVEPTPDVGGDIGGRAGAVDGPAAAVVPREPTSAAALVGAAPWGRPAGAKPPGEETAPNQGEKQGGG